MDNDGKPSPLMWLDAYLRQIGADTYTRCIYDLKLLDILSNDEELSLIKSFIVEKVANGMSPTKETLELILCEYAYDRITKTT